MSHSHSHEMLPHSTGFVNPGDVAVRGAFPQDHDGTRSDIGMSYGVQRGGMNYNMSGSSIPTPSHVHSHSHSGAMSTPKHQSHSRSGSSGSGLPMSYMTHSQSGSGIGHHQSPQHSMLSSSAPQKRTWLSESMPQPYDSNRTPPQRRTNYSQHNIPRDASYHSNIHSEGSGGRYPGE